MGEIETSTIEKETIDEIIKDGHEIVIKPTDEIKKSADEKETTDEIEKYVEENEERLRRLEKHGSRIGRIVAKVFLIKGGKEI